MVSVFLFVCFLEECFDWLVMVDLYLYWIYLFEDLFDILVCWIEIVFLFVDWLVKNVFDVVLIGFDSESW